MLKFRMLNTAEATVIEVFAAEAGVVPILERLANIVEDAGSDSPESARYAHELRMLSDQIAADVNGPLNKRGYTRMRS